MDPVVQLGEAEEITRRILTKQSVTEEEFRYVLAFNLTAMTQILWELANNPGNAKNTLEKLGAELASGNVIGNTKRRIAKFVSAAAIAAFLAGVGLGYILP